MVDKIGGFKDENLEQRQIADVTQQAGDHARSEVLSSPMKNFARQNDAAVLTDASFQTGDGAVAKTRPEEFGQAYGPTISRFPEDMKAVAYNAMQGVADLPQYQHPDIKAFNTAVMAQLKQYSTTA